MGLEELVNFLDEGIDGGFAFVVPVWKQVVLPLRDELVNRLL